MSKTINNKNYLAIINKDYKYINKKDLVLLGTNLYSM